MWQGFVLELTLPFVPVVVPSAQDVLSKSDPLLMGFSRDEDFAHARGDFAPLVIPAMPQKMDVPRGYTFRGQTERVMNKHDCEFEVSVRRLATRACVRVRCS